MEGRADMRRLAWITIAGGWAWLAAGIVVSTAPESSTTGAPSAIRTGTFVVTPVSGPSNLHRLGLTLRQSAMGWTGRLGPRPDLASSAPVVVRPSIPPDHVILTGADLYRVNCRACHRVDGTGAPDEIKSIIDPIRSTSPAIMRQRMEERGRPVSAAFARELATGTRDDVLNRLKNGGEKMPPFDHLSGVEVDALFAYLEWLAGVPGAEHRQIRVAEPAVRVGEHIIKGTCHICHGATGPFPDPEALLDGAVPSLASIVGQQSTHNILRKVRYGAPIAMGRLRLAYRGRMPVFDYLTDAEVSAAYVYLLAYPPQFAPARTISTAPAESTRPCESVTDEGRDC